MHRSTTSIDNAPVASSSLTHPAPPSCRVGTRPRAAWLDAGLQAALVALFLLFSLLFASTAHAQTPPAAPTGLMAMTGDGVGSGNVALDWDDNSESDLAGYNVYRHTASFSDTTTATRVNGNMLIISSDFFDSGLSDGTPYHYRVVAVDDQGDQSDASSEVSATPSADTTPPSAPANLAATAGTVEISLDWDDNPEMDVAGYNVYRHTTSFTDTTTATRINGNQLVPASSYQDGNGTEGTTYHYRVVAVDYVLNQGNASSEVSATMPDPPPAAPTSVSAMPGDGQVMLSWASNTESDIASYTVHRSTSSGFTPDGTNDVASVSHTGGGESYTDDGTGNLSAPSNGTTYYYKIAAVDAGANASSPSSEVSATPDGTAPSAPTNPSASAGDTEVTVSWTASPESDVYGYNLYRSTSSGVTPGSGTKVNGTPIEGTAYTDGSRTNGQAYYYVVTAVDGAMNESSASSEVSATPSDLPPAKPTGVTATAGDGQVALSWASNTESDIASYKVFRATASGFTPGSGNRIATVTHTGGGESYTDTGVSNGTTYYYQLKAVDGTGNESDASDEVTASPAADNTAPDVPARLVRADQQFGSPSGDGEVHVGWVSSVASDLAGYNLYRSTTSPVSTGDTKVNSSLIPPAQTTYVDGGVTNGTTYYYAVTAVDGSGNESSLSNEVTANPSGISDSPAGAPAAPTSAGLRVGDQEVAIVLSVANGESDLRGYNLYRNTGASCTATTGDTKVNGSTPISRGSLTYVDDGLTNGTTYCYGLTAVDFAGNESAILTSDAYSNPLRATPGASKGGVSVDFIEWLPDQSSWTSSQTGSGTFDPDTKLHYVYNGADGTNRPFDVIAYAGDEVGISGMYDLNFNDPGAKNMQGGPGDAPALSPLAGLTNGTNTKPSQTTALDTQFSPELTLTFKVYDEVGPSNELAYMIVTGALSGVSYQDNASAPDMLTLTVSPADFADTPQGGDVFPGEGGLYISFFSKAFQGSGTVPNAVFANNVYASDITASADLSQLSDMAGIKVNGTDGNPVSLKFYFNKASADGAWGTTSASDLGGFREDPGSGSFESLSSVTASTDNTNFDLNFDGAIEDTYVVDLSNDQWSTRFVTAGASGSVPVELTSFEGVVDEGAVTLRWATASETNNAGFEIERKQADGTFQPIGYVEGHGTTTSEHSYRYTDTDLPDAPGTFVYRLKQVDLDGSFEYSPEVELEVGVPERFALRAPYPNPFTNRATVRYELPQAAEVRLQVYDVLGRRVATLVDGPRPAGRQTVAFEADGLASGLYLIRMQAGSFTATQRIMLAR